MEVPRRGAVARLAGAFRRLDEYAPALLGLRREAHQHSAGARKAGVTAKPSAVSLTGGQVHDIQVHDISEADELVKQVEPKALLAGSFGSSPRIKGI